MTVLNTHIQAVAHLTMLAVGAIQRLDEHRALATQFNRMVEAAQKFKQAEDDLSRIYERMEKVRTDPHEAAINEITDMSIIAQSRWVVDNQVKPTEVRISRVGAEPITKRLVLLNEVERDALLRYWWHEVPATIKCLADDPTVAFARYVMGNIHGVSSGDVE